MPDHSHTLDTPGTRDTPDGRDVRDTRDTRDGRAVLDLDALNFGKGGGSVTVVAQDATTGTVLMVAGADREALAQTIATGEMHYTSRTRGLWHKGATSGNVQHVVSLSADCDGDAVLARVRPAGPACHTGMVSCFGAEALAADELARLDATIAARAGTATRGDRVECAVAPGGVTSVLSLVRDTPDADAPPRSYTHRLLGDRNLRLKKLGEEATELAVACADGDVPRATEEAADLLYHTLVALRALGVGVEEIRHILRARAR